MREHIQGLLVLGIILYINILLEVGIHATSTAFNNIVNIVRCIYSMYLQ